MTFDYDPPGNFRDALDDDPADSDQVAELMRLGLRIVTWEPPSEVDARQRIEEFVELDTSGIPRDALLAALLDDETVIETVRKDISEELRFI